MPMGISHYLFVGKPSGVLTRDFFSIFFIVPKKFTAIFSRIPGQRAFLILPPGW